MSTPENKWGGNAHCIHEDIVRRYFAEAVDKRNEDVLDELMTPDWVIRRREGPGPISRGAALCASRERRRRRRGARLHDSEAFVWRSSGIVGEGLVG